MHADHIRKAVSSFNERDFSSGNDDSVYGLPVLSRLSRGLCVAPFQYIREHTTMLSCRTIILLSRHSLLCACV